jgi:hypothetical protein
MTSSAPLPGGPLPDFRETIQDLAKQARQEDRRAEEDARKSRRHKSFSRFVGIGLLLIALELVSLTVLSRYQPGVAVKKPPPRSRFGTGSCNAIFFDAYWKVVKYIKDNDHPPASLKDLVPSYLDKLPFDPVTGKPLEYSTRGDQFHLNCPGARTAGR